VESGELNFLFLVIGVPLLACLLAALES